MSKKNVIIKFIALLLTTVLIISACPIHHVEASSKNGIKKMVWKTKYKGYLRDDEYDVYKISLPKSGIVKFTCYSADNGADIDILRQYSEYKDYSVNIDYSILAGGDRTYFDDNLGVYKSEFSIGLLAGVYYIMVGDVSTAFDYRNDAPGQYNITANYISSNESYTETYAKPYDYIINSKTIVSGKTYKGMVGGADDSSDMYKFSLNQADTVRITVTEEYGDLEIRLVDPSGHEITEQYTGYEYWYTIRKNGNLFWFEFEMPKGTYYLKISEYTNGLSNPNPIYTVRVNAKKADKELERYVKYNGTDYRNVYDFKYYISKYPDIKRVYGNNPEGALKHFVNYGMKEGRQGSASFDVKSYRNNYPDLRLKFGKDWKNYYIHYLNYGKNEGRKATGVTKLKNPVTKLNGVDYSAVYDYNYYIKKYPDIKKSFGDDDVAALKHFISYGMKEGRIAKSTFNINVYMKQKDLKKAFGSDKQKYYMHYINFGKKEGRTAC